MNIKMTSYLEILRITGKRKYLLMSTLLDWFKGDLGQV